MAAKSKAFEVQTAGGVRATEAVMELRAKQYFDERATQEMKENLKFEERNMK